MSDVISKRSDPAALAARLADERPADIADALNRNASRFAAKVLLALPEPLAVEVLDEPQLLRHPAIISELPPEKAAHLLDAISADRAAHIVRELRVSVRNNLLALVGPETKATLDRLLPYPENCAGGIMTTEFVAVPGDWTVGQTLEHIKAVELTRETDAHASPNDTIRRFSSSQSASRTQARLSLSVSRRPTSLSSGWSRKTSGSR